MRVSIFGIVVLFSSLLLSSCSSISSKKIILTRKMFNHYDREDRLSVLKNFQYSLERNLPFSKSSKEFTFLVRRLVSIAKKDRNSLVRAQSLDVLAILLGVQGQSYYIQALKDKTFLVRYKTLKILQKYGDYRAKASLFKVLNGDNSIHCRRESVRSLLKIGNQDFLNPLIQVLEKEEDLGVQFEIYKTLRKITKTNLPSELGSWQVLAKENKN